MGLFLVDTDAKEDDIKTLQLKNCKKIYSPKRTKDWKKGGIIFQYPEKYP